MSKNDIWRELGERLKQKAKTRFELQQTFEEEHVTAKEEWVRLEDVLSILQEIKKEYTLAEKQKLLLIKGILEKVAFKRKVEQLWVVPEKSKPYDNSPEGWYPVCIVPEFLTDRKLVIMMDEYYQELMKTLEELLRKNEG